MTAPVLTKKVTEKRRTWLRARKVGDQGAMWDGISWCEAKIIQDNGKVFAEAVNTYAKNWFSRTNGYEKLGGQLCAYIGPMDLHKKVVEVDEAKMAIRDAPLWFDGMAEDVILQAAKILRAGKRAS